MFGGQSAFGSNTSSGFGSTPAFGAAPNTRYTVRKISYFSTYLLGILNP